MKKLFLSAVVLLFSLASISQVQLGGQIRAKNNPGVYDFIKRTDYNAIYVYDSILQALLAGRLNVNIQLKNNAGVFGDVERNGAAIKVWDSALIAGGITATLAGTTKYIRGTPTTLTVTNLNSLANSATVGWQSARVDNTSTRATDYLINVKLTMANTAPANDKAGYVYLVAWYYDGSTWYANSNGTATLPSGNDASTTIASPHNLVLLGALNYTTQNMVLQGTWAMSTAFGYNMPDGFSIVIINFTGAAVSSSGNIVQYTALNNKIE